MPAVRSRQIIHEIKAGVAEALEDLAEDILEDSNAHIGIGDPRLDPDPEFALREHGHIGEHPDGGLRIWYEGPYAAAQHEHLDWEHPRGGGPKFLENALKKYIPQVQPRVARKVRERLVQNRDARGRFASGFRRL